MNLVNIIKKIPSSFFTAMIISVILFIYSLISPEMFVQKINNVNKFIFQFSGDFYLYFVYLALIIFVAIGISPLGKIKLGGKNAKPEHSMFSWFSMLFCAGMGVGLLFWGGAEPLFHFMNPPLADTVTDAQRAQAAFQMTFFHWGFHPWAIFGLTTLAVSFFSMNLKKGFRLSAFLSRKTAEELLQIREPWYKRFFNGLIDNFTCLAVLFGIVSSFGLGVLQAEGGLNIVFGLAQSYKLELFIILFITVCYMISTLRGLNRGIKVLSNFSMILSFVLLIAIPFAMPIDEFIKPIFQYFPEYIANIPNMSLGNLPFKTPDFLREWTVRYWAWWLAWAPFVGIFVSLISKGRTVRELVFSMLIAPTLYSVVCISLFGQAAIFLQQTQSFIGSTIDFTNTNTVLYKIFAVLFSSNPILTALCLFIVIIFFVNSADSATYTLAAISQKTKDSLKIKGDDVTINPPSAFLQLLWGSKFSILAGLFLFIGGLEVLQAISLITVFPFALFLTVVFGKLIVDMIIYYKKNYSEKTTRINPVDLLADDEIIESP